MISSPGSCSITSRICSACLFRIESDQSQCGSIADLVLKHCLELLRDVFALDLFTDPAAALFSRLFFRVLELVRENVVFGGAR